MATDSLSRVEHMRVAKNSLEFDINRSLPVSLSPRLTAPHLPEPSPSTWGSSNCLAADIRVRGVGCFAAEQQRMDACVSPLLFSGTWSMSCPPSSHSTIIRFLDESQRNTSSLCFCLQRPCLRKQTLPCSRVFGTPCLDTDIRLESDIGRWVSPSHSTKSPNLRRTPLPRLRIQSRIILIRTKRHIYLLSFF